MNDCKRYSVYAVGIDENNKMVVAKNGNEQECTGQPGQCGCIHAEVLLLRQMKNPTQVFVSHSPCVKCAKLLKAAGVKRVIYLNEYRRKAGIHFLKRNNVEIKKAVSGVQA